MGVFVQELFVVEFFHELDGQSVVDSAPIRQSSMDTDFRDAGWIRSPCADRLGTLFYRRKELGVGIPLVVVRYHIVFEFVVATPGAKGSQDFLANGRCIAPRSASKSPKDNAPVFQNAFVHPLLVDLQKGTKKFAGGIRGSCGCQDER